MEKAWEKDELDYLKENYALADSKEIQKVLNRSPSSIHNKAFKLRLKRMYGGTIEKLIDGSNESFYWLGFIMADGHFNMVKNQIQINLSEKDVDHLGKFAEFIDYKKKLERPSIAVSFLRIKDELISKYDISNRKTYEPCNLENLSGDSLFSLIVGFIDGDGTIDKRGVLNVVSHKNWFNNIEFMFKEIAGERFGCIITGAGLTLAYISNIETMKDIRRRAVQLKLPVMERKWDRVNFEKLSKRERHAKLESECFSLFSEGKSPKEVIASTKISRSFVYLIFKKYTTEKQNTIKERDIDRDSKRDIRGLN